MSETLNLADRIKEAMRGANVNQTMLAAMVGVKRSTVSLWLNDDPERKPKGENLERVAKILGVTEQWLVEGVGVMVQKVPESTRTFNPREEGRNSFALMRDAEREILERVKTLRPDLESNFERKVGDRFRVDYASRDLILEIKTITRSGRNRFPLGLGGLPDRLWRMSVIKMKDRQMHYDRRVVLAVYVIGSEDPELTQRLSVAQNDATLAGIELVVTTNPDEIVEIIMENSPV